jgi:hypothetical protein
MDFCSLAFLFGNQWWDKRLRFDRKPALIAARNAKKVFPKPRNRFSSLM